MRLIVAILLGMSLQSCQTPLSIFDAGMQPGELELILVTTDIHEGVQFHFRAVTDTEGRITAMRFYAPDKVSECNLAQLPRGLVLMQRSGRNIITLLSTDFDPMQGGNVTMRYLYSGISNSYREFPMRIQREGGNWRVFSNRAREGLRGFSRMFLKANRAFLAGVIGIEQVSVN